jgi:hypothetical protein
MLDIRTQFQMVALQMEVLSLRAQTAQLQAQAIAPEFERLRAAVEAEDKQANKEAVAQAVGVNPSRVEVE